jgi:hypothetical protein
MRRGVDEVPDVHGASFIAAKRDDLPLHDRERSADTEKNVAAPERESDKIQDASYDSFPASDPPPWTGTHAGPPRSNR